MMSKWIVKKVVIDEANEEEGKSGDIWEVREGAECIAQCDDEMRANEIARSHNKDCAYTNARKTQLELLKEKAELLLEAAGADIYWDASKYSDEADSKLGQFHRACGDLQVAVQSVKKPSETGS